MALTYQTPGVYVEEVPSGNRPIVGVSTSTAGFVGYVSDNVAMPPQPGKVTHDADNKPVPVPYVVAPAKTPILVTSWNSFKNNFGDIDAQHISHLAQAVYGFFNNGGSRCWVVRVNQAVSSDPADPLTDFKAAADQLATYDEISLIAAPGVTNPEAQGYLIDQCEKLQNRFAILDGNSSTASLTYSDTVPATRNSNYAAIYFPWINVGDEVVPPSGHVAGVYARVDAQRGVYKAPANEIIRGAMDVAIRMGRADQGALNVQGINVIRDFNNNITIWGARTFGPAGSEWQYINVRRLFIYLRQSIEQGTQWVVFEPNSPQLWAQIRRNITAFLTDVWHAGALFGQKPEEAFFVRCDESTNPPELRALGQVVAEIGVSVVYPAEFVIFHIQQWSAPSK